MEFLFLEASLQALMDPYVVFWNMGVQLMEPDSSQLSQRTDSLIIPSRAQTSRTSRALQDLWFCSWSLFTEAVKVALRFHLNSLAGGSQAAWNI